MHTAPQNSEEYGYNLRWLYKNRDELRSALTSVRDRILAVHTLPFLQNMARLKALVIQRRDIIESEWIKELNEHNDSIYRAKAEVAFRNKHYEEVVQCYSKIPSERLTRIDQTKLNIARKRMP
ncbi:MAG: hypothetical protein KDA78_20655 [Planctomycetaceae bacterium]|nr:hypothetical protein [Planctomycetaceae bacterium]